MEKNLDTVMFYTTDNVIETMRKEFGLEEYDLWYILYSIGFHSEGIVSGHFNDYYLVREGQVFREPKKREENVSYSYLESDVYFSEVNAYRFIAHVLAEMIKN